MFAAIMAAVGMCADRVVEGMYAARHRFSAWAAGLGYAIGGMLAWVYGIATPVHFTEESISVATSTAQKRPTILYIVALSALPSIIGALGLYSAMVDLLN